MGEWLRDGDGLTFVDGVEELPFAFGESVESEVGFEDVEAPELEIPGRTAETAPSLR